MKIVYMGTPAFSVQSLRALSDSQHDIAGVVTAPDKPVGRGLKIKCSPVKELALDLGLPVFQPQDLREPDFLTGLRHLAADLFVVVAFRILPPEVFEMPPKGTINLHSSLLPRYRGAAPINWAIINGETETGVSTIFIQKDIDAGDLILQKRIAIGQDETAGELHDKLAVEGAKLLLETVDLIAKGKGLSIKQTGVMTRAPKLTRELGNVDWRKSNVEIRNLIRGLSPVPGAYTYLHGKVIKLYRTSLEENHGGGRPGQIIEVEPRKGSLVVATGSGNLRLETVQPEGKRKMTAREFLLGHKLENGDCFGSK
ncbi:MAG: methionyl-tRNA formyltransferase [bacterium]